jgi:hypothetical protein
VIHVFKLSLTRHRVRQGDESIRRPTTYISETLGGYMSLEGGEMMSILRIGDLAGYISSTCPFLSAIKYHLNLVRVRRISTWLRCRTCSLYIWRVNRQLTRTTLTSDESPPTKWHWRSKSSLHTCRSLVTFINCRKIKLSGLGFGLDVNQPSIDKNLLWCSNLVIDGYVYDI